MTKEAVQEMIDFLEEVKPTRDGVYFVEKEDQEIIKELSRAWFLGFDPNDPAIYIDPYNIEPTIRDLKKWMEAQ